MSSSSKRLRNISPEPAAADKIAEAREDFRVIAPLRSKSTTCKDDNAGSSVFTCSVNKLLPVILDNSQILTPKDLLHCRLVNRRWRDEATSVLLKNCACEILLKIGVVARGDDAHLTSYEQLLEIKPNDDSSSDKQNFKYFSARPPHSLLPDLIRTISGSKQFPASGIKFLPGCEKALKNLRLSRSDEMYEQGDDDLVKLFALWGKNIQKLTICDRISSNSVEKLLFLLTPHLRCLQFDKCYRFETEERDTKYNQVFHLGKFRNRKFNSNQRLSKLETIIPGEESNLHWSKTEFFKLLVHISPNLRVVQDSGIGALSLLVKMKKAHLIKSLIYNPVSRHQHECGDLKEALELYPTGGNPPIQLSGLTIQLSRMSGKRAAYGTLTRILNLLLKGSKDTLEYLEFHVNPQDFLVNIKIPLLKKLKCLKLVRENEPFQNPLVSKKSNDKSENNSLALVGCVYARHVFQFEDRKNPHKIPPNYFPALSKVELDVDDSAGSWSWNTCNKLFAFFALEQTGTDDGSAVTGDVINSVTNLELSAFPKVDHKLGGLFPNIRYLRVKCESPTELQNWVWRAFPNLEKFQIYDLIPGTGNSKAVDSFFTGIPPKFCTKVAANIDTIARPELTPEQNPFYRTQPYIVDCRTLKEFKIHFKTKISDTFATKLSSVFAFQGIIHKTKIVFSFESVDLSEQDVEEMQKHLEPVAAYIEIRI